MASRHVFTQRLKSGVIFSAPGNLMTRPEGGWGDDTPITRRRKPKRKVQGRGLDHFSPWIAKATPYDEPYDDISSFTPVRGTRGIGNEYRPYSISPYPETEVETAAPKIPEVTLCLPMLSVSLTATVDGTVAHTELVQKFHNPSDIIIDAAKHVFPLYDGAVITSFECTIGDERRVRGVVKPKVQARKEFEEGIRDKVAAPALLEEHTPEIFETSLGNIPANTTVEIRITPGEYSNLSEKDSAPKNYYVWHHVSEPAVLRKDFVFVVQMNEGHQIKSRAIACPVDDKGLAAMMVHIRPNDLFRNSIIPQSFTGEILFLLDQSASMGWTNGSPDYDRRHTGARKIDVMREAMLLALSGIPSTCVFNVISWGSATMGLWETSRPHTKENIREAKTYVSQVEADMGGTDLLRALESTLKRRVQDRGSTQIIILTDGELEPEDSIQFIWKKRQLFGDSLRFFALGIGDEVSHRLVESIAECGGGYSDVVHTTQTPRWHDRLNRLLKSALEPNSWSCDIDLGSGFERKSLVDYELEQQTPAESHKTPYVQGPFPISSLHPFSFASISFLIDLRRGGELPKTVTINTTTAGAKKKTYELPIEQAPGNDGTIHRLVAKSTLLDLQDETKRVTGETQIAKTNAEYIGTTYSITSKWTSFVAVSENQPAQTVEEQKMNHYKALFDEIDIDELLNNVSDDETSSCGSTSGSSSIMGYGARQSPGMNSMAGPPTSQYHMMPEISILEYAKRIAPSDTSSVPALMPKPCPPARPPAGMSPMCGSLGGLRQCSLDGESDEPEAPRPAQNMSDPVQIKVQGSVDRITDRSLRISDRSNEVPGPSPYEDLEAQTASDVRIPTRERVQDNSPVSTYADFPLYPNDSDWHEAPRLDRSRADTTDDSQSDLPAPIEEYTLARKAAAVTNALINAEAQKKAVPASKACRVNTYSGNRRPQLPKDYAYDGRPDGDACHGSQSQNAAQEALAASDSDGRALESANSATPPVPYAPPIPSGQFLRPRSIATSERLRERVIRLERFPQADVDDESMDPPRANRGFAITTGIIKQGEQHESDDDGTGERMEVSGQIELVQRNAAALVGGFDDDGPWDEVSELPSSTPKGLPIEACGDESYNFEAGAELVTNMSSRARGLSPGGAAERLQPPGATSRYISPGQALSSQAHSLPKDYGWEPQFAHETVPGGPKFPTYKAMPIPNTRFQDFFTGRSVKQRRGASNRWGSDYDSDDSSMSRGISEPSSSQSNVFGPLDWQFAMECQDGQGLFDLYEKRPSLHLHFCPETATKFGLRISELLSNSSTPEEERDDVSARILDTLMMIECYKTHRAQEEDTWDLMMERARDAVISLLRLPIEIEERALEALGGQFRGAMMHAHYVAATGVKDSENDDSSVETMTCPACDVYVFETCLLRGDTDIRWWIVRYPTAVSSDTSARSSWFMLLVDKKIA
ncbi:hypothetical protein J7337_006467 [Fusarium musae]|uniref:VWFA domain-containing protein n=1 Tax=Fusarium musae TaxID=1042133 RepID=A0A9P8DFF5_9HYPO|nr:hypothetical protein J7337_006467 [Fusarium musae]KAG9500787.1 hypothetical protein J7337_006467 [Fusarium musae]